MGPVPLLASADLFGQPPPALATYGYLLASRAALLAELGRVEEAATAYRSALLLTEHTVERAHLAARLTGLTR